MGESLATVEKHSTSLAKAITRKLVDLPACTIRVDQRVWHQAVDMYMHLARIEVNLNTLRRIGPHGKCPW